MSFNEYPYPPVREQNADVDRRLHGGPVQGPIIPALPTDDDCCKKLLQAMFGRAGGGAAGGGMGGSSAAAIPIGQIAANFTEFWRDLYPSGEGVRSFIFFSGAPASAVPVASGISTPLNVVSGLINEGYYGILQSFSVNIDPAPAAGDITVQIKVSGNVQPKLSANTLSMDVLGQKQPFYLKLAPGSTVELWVTNTGTAAVAVTAALFGFMRPIK